MLTHLHISLRFLRACPVQFYHSKGTIGEHGDTQAPTLLALWQISTYDPQFMRAGHSITLEILSLSRIHVELLYQEVTLIATEKAQFCTQTIWERLSK